MYQTKYWLHWTVTSSKWLQSCCSLSGHLWHKEIQDFVSLQSTLSNQIDWFDSTLLYKTFLNAWSWIIYSTLYHAIQNTSYIYMCIRILVYKKYIYNYNSYSIAHNLMRWLKSLADVYPSCVHIVSASTCENASSHIVPHSALQ